jgi:hypothetical protein
LNYKILCESDATRPIKFDIYDFNHSGNHGYVGTVETTMSSLSKNKTFEVINLDKLEKSKKV